MGAMTRFPRCMLGTCCVPWTEAGALDEPRFRRSIRHTLAHGTQHLYVFGTAGEGYAVNDAQFDRITRVFVEETTAGGGEAMVGVISPSLTTVLARIERAAALGVRQVQVSLPSWGACTPAETRAFFAEVCGRFPGLSFCHYNLRRAGRLVEPAEYVELAAAHPNLVAVKCGTDSVRYLCDLIVAGTPLRFFFVEQGFAAACLLGLEAGLLVSLSSISWTRCRQFFAAGVEGRTEELRRLTGELSDIRQMLFDAVGPAGHMDGSRDKLFAKAHLPEFPLRLLPPYQGSTEAGFERFVRAVRSRYPHWLDGSAVGEDSMRSGPSGA